ncbi:hypothetical protein C8J57DRAFT_1223747 [Mycena rebaudengoi]|nr:hypothetical protein C8J57DRAFT_1223747 [Mycena rebaudengoi]
MYPHSWLCSLVCVGLVYHDSLKSGKQLVTPGSPISALCHKHSKAMDPIAMHREAHKVRQHKTPSITFSISSNQGFGLMARLIDFLVNENDIYVEAGITMCSDNMESLFSSVDAHLDSAVPRGIELACLADSSAAATSSYTDCADRLMSDTASSNIQTPVSEPALPQITAVQPVPGLRNQNRGGTKAAWRAKVLTIHPRRTSRAPVSLARIAEVTHGNILEDAQEPGRKSVPEPEQYD